MQLLNSLLELTNPSKHRFREYELDLGVGEDSGLVQWTYYWHPAVSEFNAARVVGWGLIIGPCLILRRWHLISDSLAENGREIGPQEVSKRLDRIDEWNETDYVLKFYDLGGFMIWDVNTQEPIAEEAQRKMLVDACKKATLPRPPGMNRLLLHEVAFERIGMTSAKLDFRRMSAPWRGIFVETSPRYESLFGLGE